MDTINFPVEITHAFDMEISKFPIDQKQSAVMACLAIVQRQLGWISPDAIHGIAKYLGLTQISVQEVSTFYNMYNNSPVGQFKLNICTNLPCQLGAHGGGEVALKYICSKLGIEPYETTIDGLFTVQPSECLGACADAPVMLVNDQAMCSYMNSSRLDQLIDGLRFHCQRIER
jgi:NADH-quinone oxidoreductase subunit E